MAEKPSVKQILEVYYALRASGVQRFPKPLQRALPERRVSGGTLFLFDFVSSGSAHDSPPSLIKRLIERLPWGSGIDVSAVFEVQPKSPDFASLIENSVTRLRAHLEASGGRRIVCFGWRAAHVLSVALGAPYEIPAEAFEPLACESEGLGSFELLVLPDVRELEAFPGWRLKVWESLVAFAPPV